MTRKVGGKGEWIEKGFFETLLKHLTSDKNLRILYEKGFKEKTKGHLN